MSLAPLRIDFDKHAIDDLHGRLDGTRWPEHAWDTGWTTGTDDRVLRDLVRYWRADYDWFAQQARLNELEHLQAAIAGESVHCVRYAAEGERCGALLLMHGWPGSFVEFLDAAPRLAEAGFDVIVPSLPGFALSQAPSEPGMDPGRIAERMHALMSLLGYVRYGVQGGDWGAAVGTALALQQPDAVAALHLNLGFGSGHGASERSAAEQEYLEQRRQWEGEESAYSTLQGTRPQTLGYALHDSPVGLLAWILEKLWAWSDHADDLWDTFDRDRVLTNVMLYWLTGRITSAARLYYEARHATQPFAGQRVEVPTGYASFPREVFRPPRDVLERWYNLVHFAELPRGGHFAAMEQPELFAGEVAGFFSAHVLA